MFELKLQRANPAFRPFSIGQARLSTLPHAVGLQSINAEIERLIFAYQRDLPCATYDAMPIQWPEPTCGVEAVALAKMHGIHAELSYIFMQEKNAHQW